MPQIRFTESAIDRLPFGSLTWYSHEPSRTVSYPGLRLGVTRTAKTWYLSKRNPHTGKTVSVKLGRFPALSPSAAFELAQKESKRIDAGQPIEDDALPTFRVMLDRYIARQTRSGRLAETTAEEYRRLAKNHLSAYLDKPLDHVCRRADKLTDHLEALKDRKPYVATKAAVVVGAVFVLAAKLYRNRGLFNPVETFDPVPMRKRAIDHEVPWKDRLAEIEAVSNAVHRAAWLLLWHTGIRSGNLRSLTWDQVDLDARTVTLDRMKNHQSRTLPLSDYAVEVLRGLVGLHLKWVFPSVRNGVHIDHLDSLPLTTQHELRHLWTTAAGLCHLPSYVIAFLKGDVVQAENQTMMAHYLGNVGTHEAANQISAKILEKCTSTPG